MARLGILVLSPPKESDIRLLRGLCAAAREKGVEVEVFFMSDGVHHLGDPRMGELAKQGAKLSFCALNAMERSLDHRPEYPWGIEEASQFSLACIAEQSDRFLCLA